MITELTPEQKAKFPEYVKLGMSIGHNTDKINFAEACSIFAEAYKASKLDPPKYYVYAPDLKAANSMVSALKVRWPENSTEVPTQDEVNKFCEEHRNDLYTQVESIYETQVWAGWYAWRKFYENELKFKFDHPLLDLNDRLIKSCYCAMTFDDLVIIVDRPAEVSLDDRGRLHCENGPAFLGRGGMAVFALEGVRVPQKVVMEPEKLTTDEIDQEKNSEVARLMIQRYGVGKYLQETGAKLIDMDALSTSIQGSAPRALYEDKKKQKWLIGTDGSTTRVYNMAVPSEAKTCAEAHRMISGLDKEDRIIAEC